MKTSKMYLAILGLVLTTGLAHADDDSLKNDFSVSCSGSQGSVVAQVASGVLNYQVIWHGKVFSGLMPDTYPSKVIHPESDPTGNWVNIISGINKPVWLPEYPTCLPTRVINQCTPSTGGGYYQQVSTESFDLIVDFDDQGTLTFSRLNLDLPGLKTTLKSLGEDTECSIQGVQLVP